MAEPVIIKTDTATITVSHDSISIEPKEGFCFGPGATGIWYNTDMDFSFIPTTNVDNNDLYQMELDEDDLEEWEME